MLEPGRDELVRIVEAVTLARDLINTPANDMGPQELETAAGAGKQISLHDMQVAAERYRSKYADALTLTHNLQTSPLAGLILIQGP